MSSPIDLSGLPPEIRNQIFEFYLDKGQFFPLEYDLEPDEAPALLRFADEVTQSHFYRDNVFGLPIFFSSFDWLHNVLPDISHGGAKSFDPTGATGMKRTALKSIKSLWLILPDSERFFWMHNEPEGMLAEATRWRLPRGSSFVPNPNAPAVIPPQTQLADLDAFTALTTVTIDVDDFMVPMRLVYYELKNVTHPLTWRFHLDYWLGTVVRRMGLTRTEPDTVKVVNPNVLQNFHEAFDLAEDCGHQLAFRLSSCYLLPRGTHNVEESAANAATVFLASLRHVPHLNYIGWKQDGYAAGYQLVELRRVALLEETSQAEQQNESDESDGTQNVDMGDEEYGYQEDDEDEELEDAESRHNDFSPMESSHGWHGGSPADHQLEMTDYSADHEMDYGNEEDEGIVECQACNEYEECYECEECNKCEECNECKPGKVCQDSQIKKVYEQINQDVDINNDTNDDIEESSSGEEPDDVNDKDWEPDSDESDDMD